MEFELREEDAQMTTCLDFLFEKRFLVPEVILLAEKTSHAAAVVLDRADRRALSLHASIPSCDGHRDPRHYRTDAPRQRTPRQVMMLQADFGGLRCYVYALVDPACPEGGHGCDGVVGS